MYTITVNSISYGVAPSSLRISSQLQGRTTASFSLTGNAASLPGLENGREVTITDGVTKLFAGTISGVSFTPLPAHTDKAVYNIECVDYSELCDRRRVGRLYEGMSLGDIVRDIVNSFMDEEGIDVSGVVPVGTQMDFALFNYNTVTTAFNDLSERTGYQWRIDYDKVLHFYKPEDDFSDLVLNSDFEFRNLRVRTSKDKLRNVQYVAGGKGVSDPLTESFRGDGDARTWTVSLPIAHTPTVTVNGNPKTVGMGGLSFGKDFYWNKDNNVFSQDFDSPVLTASDNVIITYQGFFPILVKSLSNTNIAQRQSLEGGSGKYESLITDQDITDSASGIETANGLIRRYSKISEVITFETDTPGLRAGQLLAVDLPAFGIAGDYLIDSVQLVDVDAQLYRHNVRILSGESFGGWLTFFRKLTEASASYVIRGNELLIEIRNFQERLQVADTFGLSTDVDNRVGFAIVGFSPVA